MILVEFYCVSLGDRLSADRSTMYYARFCQLIFSYWFSNVLVQNADKNDGFRINKRDFKDLIFRDGKKIQLPPLKVRAQARQFLIDNLPLCIIRRIFREPGCGHVLGTPCSYPRLHNLNNPKY